MIRLPAKDYVPQLRRADLGFGVAFLGRPVDTVGCYLAAGLAESEMDALINSGTTKHTWSFSPDSIAALAGAQRSEPFVEVLTGHMRDVAIAAAFLNTDGGAIVGVEHDNGSPVAPSVENIDWILGDVRFQTVFRASSSLFLLRHEVVSKESGQSEGASGV